MGFFDAMGVAERNRDFYNGTIKIERKSKNEEEKRKLDTSALNMGR